VFCEQWKRTKLLPGGMAEFFGVPVDNLFDTLRVDDLKAVDAALIEPLGCVVKSIDRARMTGGERVAVIGLGVMGLMHMLLLPRDAVAYERAADRRERALQIGLDARESTEADGEADVVFVCPGSESALRFALELAAPGATIVLFAPLPPGETTALELGALYFRDYRFVNTYSCGPKETAAAAAHVREGKLTAEHVVSHFITLDELPWAYDAMKSGRILKPMVIFQ
jgi:L-iditol 2-dehydrogenase